MTVFRSLAASRFRLMAAIVLGTLILMGAGDDSARLEKLGHKLICMCGCNQILKECNHYGCPYLTPEQQEVVAAVDKGDSDSTILQAFVDEYGPTVLAAPTKKGFDVVAWIMPYLMLFAGVAGVVFIVYTWRGRMKTVPSPTSNATANAALDRFREQARKETDL